MLLLLVPSLVSTVSRGKSSQDTADGQATLRRTTTRSQDSKGIVPAAAQNAVLVFPVWLVGPFADLRRQLGQREYNFQPRTYQSQLYDHVRFALVVRMHPNKQRL
jgi:hypothetical protein